MSATQTQIRKASTLNGRRFCKMHGLGNDFIVLDARDEPLCLNKDQIVALSNRRNGIGCDQFIIMEPGDDQAQAFMRIYNSDGSQISACGNATRCIARVLMSENQTSTTTIRTQAGLLHASQEDNGLITADMGPAILDWQSIPLSEAKDTLSLPIMFGALENPVAVSVGNPHAVFFVPDAEAIDLASVGPVIETHPLFPEKTNVEIAHLIAPNRIRMRVWERGAGITQACGTGACATLVAAARRGITGRKAEIILDGGSLTISWNENNHVLMTGPATLAYTGVIEDITPQGLTS